MESVRDYLETIFEEVSRNPHVLLGEIGVG
jgi:hypothetical protein